MGEIIRYILFEGGVYSRAAFIANFVTTSVHLLFN